jgi:hypothetical protein
MQQAMAQQAKELRLLKERYDRQRTVRWNLEMHLKEIFRDYKFLKRSIVAQNEDVAKLLSANKELDAEKAVAVAATQRARRKLEGQQRVIDSVKVHNCYPPDNFDGFVYR